MKAPTLTPPPPVTWFERDPSPSPAQTVALKLNPGAVISGGVYRSLNTVMLSRPGDQLLITAVPAVRFESVSWPGHGAVPPGLSVEVREDRILIRAETIPAGTNRAEYAISLRVGDKPVTLDPILDRDATGGGPSISKLN
jgi:hypothetical protein